MIDPTTSVNALKKKAQDLGFDLVGVASIADPALRDEMERYHGWIDAGRGATMDYLRRHESRRPTRAFSPKRPLRHRCWHGLWRGKARGLSGRCANFSLRPGPDYHDVLGTRLEELALRPLFRVEALPASTWTRTGA